MRGRRQHDVTTTRTKIERGRKWIAVLIYPVAFALGVIYWAQGVLTSSSSTAVQSMMTSNILLGLVILAVVAQSSILSDILFLRDANSHWTPDFLWHLGVGIGTPVVIGVGASLFGYLVIGFGVGLLSLLLITFGQSIYYLRERRKYVGIP